MADYLKNFETTAEYEEYIDGDFLKPNVSYLIDNNLVRYNPVPPLRNGVDWANILASGNMIATYKGKPVVGPNQGTGSPLTILRPQDTIDEYIANDTRWSDIIKQGYGGPPIDRLIYDDREPITDWVWYSDVPGDADCWIVQEPAFYFK